MPSKQQLQDRQRMAETEHLLSKILHTTGVPEFMAAPPRRKLGGTRAVICSCLCCSGACIAFGLHGCPTVT